MCLYVYFNVIKCKIIPFINVRKNDSSILEHVWITKNIMTLYSGFCSVMCRCKVQCVLILMRVSIVYTGSVKKKLQPFDSDKLTPLMTFPSHFPILPFWAGYWSWKKAKLRSQVTKSTPRQLSSGAHRLYNTLSMNSK